MIRKILNIIIFLVVLGLIFTVGFNLYQKNKLESNKFTNSVSEKIKDDNNKSSKDSNKNTTSDKSTKDSSKNTTNNSNDSLDKDDLSTNNDNVSVESTSSFKNEYVGLLGSISIVFGAFVIVFLGRK